MEIGGRSGMTTMKLAVAAVVSLALCVAQLAMGQGYGWGSGHITYYGAANGGGTMGGACGYGNTYSLGYGINTAALSTPLFEGGAACGACFLLKCNAPQWCYSSSRTITITATNFCPPGSSGGWCDPPRPHFDLPMPMFNTLARQSAGVVPVLFRRVNCAKSGGVRFQLGGNPYFMMILISNVGGAGDARAVSIKGAYTGWIPMTRNFGAIWTCRTKLTGQPLSFQIRTSDGRTLTTYNAISSGWRIGQTWEGGNFR